MLACLLSFTTGFLSLSIEILWIRLFSYAHHSLPQAFAFVLTFYLLGIAIGADIGKRFCNGKYNLWVVSGVALLFSSACDFASPWIFVDADKHPLIVAATLITLTSLLKAIVFPIAHHLGTANINANLGNSVSKVYVSNIFGSTIGPLLTGLFLLSYFTTQQSFFICASLVFMTAIFCLSVKVRTLYLGFAAACMAFMVYSLWLIDGHLLIDKLSIPYLKTHRIVENQYGIVTTYYAGRGGDLVTGGNVYDGRTNLDPVINSNSINRLLILAALHDRPQRILMIGLSIGTWLKIVSGFPGVKHIDVIEINPGYLQAIKDYPAQASVLKDPRVSLYIDDGRRWLKAHPTEKYDLIIMNTTYSWRAYSSNLLSHEFITLVKKHLQPQGLLTYNTTDSPDAFKTANTLFKHAYLYINFVVAADFDWRPRLTTQHAKAALKSVKLDGKSIFPPGSDSVIDTFLTLSTSTYEQIAMDWEQLGRKIEVITDKNLICEYRYGKHL